MPLSARICFNFAINIKNKYATAYQKYNDDKAC